MSLFDSSSKAAKFDTVGATVTGTVKSAPRERQQTNFTTKQPAFWPNGDPMMQILVDLQTDQRADANDDGERTLYVASKHMKRAISDAIRDAGATDLLPGGVLTVQYVGNDPASKNPQNPAKMYAASYTAPASAFAGAPAAPAAPSAPVAPAAPAAPQQAFVPQHVPQPATAPAAPQAAPGQAHPSGLTADQIAKLQQLRAAGIDDTTITTAIVATPQQLATYDATPF